MTPGSTNSTPQLFRFDRGRAAASLSDPDGELWPVNAYSDADELNSLLEAALGSGIIAGARPSDHIYVYPLSICEPEPLLAVAAGVGPTLLGHELGLRERDGEDPIALTLRFLAELSAAASSLVAAHRADSDCLDRLAAYLSRPGQWNGGDVCELLAKELLASGRHVVCKD